MVEEESLAALVGGMPFEDVKLRRSRRRTGARLPRRIAAAGVKGSSGVEGWIAGGEVGGEALEVGHGGGLLLQEQKRQHGMGWQVAETEVYVWLLTSRLDSGVECGWPGSRRVRDKGRLVGLWRAQNSNSTLASREESNAIDVGGRGRAGVGRWGRGV